MRKRTVKQLDREIRRVEKRLTQLKKDRTLLALGIEPRNQLEFCMEPPPEPVPIPDPAKQLLLI
jgi:hypothetical protein